MGEKISYQKAHTRHVQHLRDCLLKCLTLEDQNERKQFLHETYQPLIFQPIDPENVNDTMESLTQLARYHIPLTTVKISG